MATVETGNGGFLGHAGQMLHAHPGQPRMEESALLDCIQACFDCAQSCVACADACLGEENPSLLARCIRLNQDCAGVCETTGHVLTRQTAFERELAVPVLHACEAACRLCAEECETHAAMHEHCRICAEACRRCQQACQRVLTGV